MAELTTKYMGNYVRNPIIIGSYWFYEIYSGVKRT